MVITTDITKSENYYRLLFENAYDAIFVETLDGQIVDVNPAACRLLGYTREELLALNVADLLPPTSGDVAQVIAKELATGGRSFDSWNMHKDGRKIPVEVRINRLEDAGSPLAVVIVREISDRYEAEAKAAREKLIFDSLHAMAIGLMQRSNLFDVLESIVKHACKMLNTAHAFIYMNADEPGFLELKIGTGIYVNHTGYRLKIGEGLVGRVWLSDQPAIIQDYQQWAGKLTDKIWSTIVTAVGIPMRAQGRVVGVMGLDLFSDEYSLKAEDVSLFERLAELASIAIDNAFLEERLQFLSYRDALTGVYNRTFFENELTTLCDDDGTNALLICDIDELKLVNDFFGHKEGDLLLIKAAKLLKNYFADKAIISRIGGDEFAIIVRNTGESEIEAICFEIRNKLVEMKEEIKSQIPLEISLGYALSTESGRDVQEQFRLADNRMYRQKLHNRNFRGSLVQTMKQMLAERDYLTDGHASRMQEMVAHLARALGQAEKNLDELRLFAYFHDLGKIGIPDRILFKPGPLSPEERQEMQRHSEVGQRIAQSSVDLQPIADWILKHHERWDGKGYPLGIAGYDIPLECRILSIVDSFDAMTSDRPYRKALSLEAAIAELKRNSGTQFDPMIVGEFVRLIQKEHETNG